MPVLTTSTIPLDISAYDQIGPHIAPQLKAARGFHAHAVHSEQPGTFTVTEIWDSAEDHASFFNQHVRPNLPDGVRVTVTELHAALVS